MPEDCANRKSKVKVYHLDMVFCISAVGIVWTIFMGFVTPLSLFAASPSEGNEAQIVREVPYADSAAGDRRQSFDLYLPRKAVRKPPLLIFVHGGFWVLHDDDYRIGPSVARTLVKEGVAVALLRYRLAPAHRHPAQVEDVAAGVALLLRETARYGYDPERVFLAGHSAGAHLAALVALEPRYLGKFQASPRSLAGVIPMSGLYDLQPGWAVSDNQKIAIEQAFGKNSAVLRQASPVAHARADAPPFLILTSQSDFPGFLGDAKHFSDTLKRAGHKKVERWIVPDRDHFTMMRLGDRDNEARLLLLEFLKVSPLPAVFRILVEAKRRWRKPPFSTEAFWRDKKRVRSYPVDQRFVGNLVAIYSSVRHELLEWPLEKFHAIDLLDYLDSLPAEKVGKGDFIVTTNIKNERQYWKRGEIAPFKPVIVVGLDDERNLFRLGVFYRARREYSWKDGPQPPMMSRPLGAFIYFLKKPPQKLHVQAAHYGLTAESFKLTASDPLGKLRNLPKDILETLTFRNGCVYCHSFRGVGSRSGHVSAMKGTLSGGFALPLESYPPEVWQQFIFDQDTAARKIGASPNPVAAKTRQALYDLVVRSR